MTSPNHTNLKHQLSLRPAELEGDVAQEKIPMAQRINHLDFADVDQRDELLTQLLGSGVYIQPGARKLKLPGIIQRPPCAAAAPHGSLGGNRAYPRRTP